jgi:hypothetical protein
LDLEFTVLNIDVEDEPHISWLQLRTEIVHLVPGDVGNIIVHASDVLDNLLDFYFDILDLLHQNHISAGRKRVDVVIKDPSGLVIYLLFVRVESLGELNLESLGYILFSNLQVSFGSEKIIDILGHEFILESLDLIHLGIESIFGRIGIDPLLENLLFFNQIIGALLIKLLGFHRDLVSLNIIVGVINVSNFFEFSTSSLDFLDNFKILIVEFLTTLSVPLLLFL